MSKRIIVYLTVLGFFSVLYYKTYKNNVKGKLRESVFHEVCTRIPNGTDPIRVEDSSSIAIISKVYEGLYAYHPFKRPFVLEPNLAEEMLAVSTDGLTYTIRMKKGVFFQDNACFPGGKGRELKAADVVFTLKRLLDPKNTVPYVGFIEGKIVGLDGWSRQSVIDYSQEVEGLRALDAYTLQVKLVRPWPHFTYFLAMCPAYIVPQEAITYYGETFVNHPVGTGPFMLKDAFSMQTNRIEFVKNPTCRETLFPTEAHPPYQHVLAYAGKKLPLVDKVMVHIITEEHPKWLKLQNAEVDVLCVENPTYLNNFMKDGELLPQYAQKLELVRMPGLNTEFFAFNYKIALFNNVYLRQAISTAFDRETYNARFYNQSAEEAHSIVPSALLPGGGKSRPNVYSYNVERAKEYLAKAGYPAGKGLPIITLDARAETTYKHKADFFAQCMADIGIRVQVRIHPWRELYEMLCKQKTMMHALTWTADYPEPSTFLEIVKDGRVAGLHYSSSEFNTLLNKAKELTDKQEQEKLYATLNQMVAEQLPMICAVHAPVQYICYKWVKNFAAYNDFDLSFAQYIAIDMDEKARIRPK